MAQAPTFNELVNSHPNNVSTVMWPSTERCVHDTGNSSDCTPSKSENIGTGQYQDNRDRCVLTTNLLALNYNINSFKSLTSKLVIRCDRSMNAQSTGKLTQYVRNYIFFRPLLLEIQPQGSSNQSNIAIACSENGEYTVIAKNVICKVINCIKTDGHLGSGFSSSTPLNIDRIAQSAIFKTTNAYNSTNPDNPPSYAQNTVVTYYTKVIKFDYIIFKKKHHSSSEDINDLYPYAAYGIGVYSDINHVEGDSPEEYHDVMVHPEDYEATKSLYKVNGEYSKIKQMYLTENVDNDNGSLLLSVHLKYDGNASTPQNIYTIYATKDVGPIVHIHENTLGHSPGQNMSCASHNPHIHAHAFDNMPNDDDVQPDQLGERVQRASHVVQLYSFRASIGVSCYFVNATDTAGGTTLNFSYPVIDLYQQDLVNTNYNVNLGSSDVFKSGQMRFRTPTSYFTDTRKYDFVRMLLGEAVAANLTRVLYYPYSSDGGNKQWGYDADEIQTESTVTIDVNIDADRLDDIFKLAYTDPSIMYLDNTPFITPMEYYGRISDSVQFTDKVNNIVTAVEAEPVYFWVETFKNWCTFALNDNLSTDALKVVDLKIWNGNGDWYPLSYIINSYKTHYITDEQKEHYRYILEHYDRGSQEYKQAQAELKDFISMILARQLLLPFKFENLHTVDIDRSYHSNKADYAGHKASHWWDYTPFPYIARACYKVAMAVWNYSPYGMIYNGIWGDGVWTGIKTTYSDLFDAAFYNLGHSIIPAVKLGAKLFFSPCSSDDVASDDPYQHLQCSCRYIALPYDEHYSSNDKDTFQTIKSGIVRYDFLEGGIINREKIIDYSVIPTTVGSPFVVRNSTGELFITSRMYYSGPVQEKAECEKDLLKFSGILEADVSLTNKMLQTQFGKGEDKTASDMFNTYGPVPEDSVTKTVTSRLPFTMQSNEVETLENVKQVPKASISMKANRSKTTSDVETIAIDTLKKW